MFMAIPHILNVLLVSFIFYLIFGIFCVTFLKGRFFYCYVKHFEEHEVKIDEHLIKTKFDCLNFGGEWLNQDLNFDNTFKAMQQLYAMGAVSWN